MEGSSGGGGEKGQVPALGQGDGPLGLPDSQAAPIPQPQVLSKHRPTNYPETELRPFLRSLWDSLAGDPFSLPSRSTAGLG